MVLPGAIDPFDDKWGLRLVQVQTPPEHELVAVCFCCGMLLRKSGVCQAYMIDEPFPSSSRMTGPQSEAFWLKATQINPNLYPVTHLLQLDLPLSQFLITVIFANPFYRVMHWFDSYDTKREHWFCRPPSS
jgi:hypothetical protein